jgi:hypothetical protein
MATTAYGVTLGLDGFGAPTHPHIAEEGRPRTRRRGHTIERRRRTPAECAIKRLTSNVRDA